MNWEQVAGDWTRFKGELKEEWGKLSDDELREIGGRRDQLVGALQQRYGISREEAEARVEGFLSRRG